MKISTLTKTRTKLYPIIISGSLMIAALYGIYSTQKVNSALDLHSSPACGGIYSNHELVWSSSGVGLDWPDGSLSQTFSDVDNSGVSFTFTYSGETSKFDVLNDQTPCVMDFFNGYQSDALSHYVDPGFTGSGITLTIDISPAIPATIAFDLYHINGSSYSGDEVQIYAVPTAGGSNIYPSFTANSNPSWEEDGNGTVDAIAASTSSNDAYVGVNFNSGTMIDQIILVWRNCDMCGGGEHGIGIGNIEFCSTSTTFPVEWVSVSGEVADNTARILWETTREINADYYQIERQERGSGLFQTIGKVSANNNASEINKYQFADQQLTQLENNREILYRIKQVDVDGKFEYSKTIELVNNIQPFAINVYPNPATDIVHIDLNGSEDFQYLNVLDMQGRSMLNSPIQGQIENNIKLDVRSWPKGNYIIMAKGMNGSESKKLSVR